MSGDCTEQAEEEEMKVESNERTTLTSSDKKVDETPAQAPFSMRDTAWVRCTVSMLQQ